MAVDRVLLAEPRGFCAGVEKAIKALAWMVRVFEPPVYCYHEIVHNRHVVEQFTRQGVVFVDAVDEVPDGAPLMLSAHGSAPEVIVAARGGGKVVVDAVCPLVTKVHHELKVRAAKGYTVLYVGHQGHEEAVGTMAVAPEAVRLVEEPADVDRLLDAGSSADHQPAVALLAQTTLSHDEWAGIVDRARSHFPDLWMPNRSDLCFATTNRQSALKALAAEADAVVVIGSDNSSNTMALTVVAAAFGCPRVLRINEAAELPDDLEGTVGVTAGASAPEALVQAVVERLAPRRGVEHRAVTTEEEYFPPPPELRELLRGLETALSLLAPAPPADRTDGVDATGALAADRELAAADVLADLEIGSTGGPVDPIGRENAPMTATSFTSMDVSTGEQWAAIGRETYRNQGRVADRVLGLLESLAEVVDGFAVDQLTHCLQTATRAERAGADDELVVASLCHDIGKAISVPGHPRIAAEILRPYVREEVTATILVHQDFQGRHYYHHFDMDPDIRDRYRDEPWYGLAERFADEWDQTSFDPDYPTEPLPHFEPKVRAVFASPKSL